MRYPAFTLFVLLNILLPLGAAGALNLFGHFQQRTLLLWLFAILLFTFNQFSARHWIHAAWLFWLASALNLAVLPFGAPGFAAALPELPRYLEQILAWDFFSG